MLRRPVLVGLSGAVVALLLGILLWQGAVAAQGREPDVLRARAIELVDERGRVRAQLDVEDDGEVVLRLRDESGAIRVKIGAAQDGSGLLLLDENTEPGVHLLAKADGTSLRLRDGDEERVLGPDSR